MGNPLIDQGTLNRLKASVTWDNFPNLNVSASYLGREGIRLALQGVASKAIETMTGLVQSPEAYQLCEIRMNLIKAQPLADAYKAQQELNSLLGNCTVRPDASPLSPYPILNCSIMNVEPLDFSGESEAYRVICSGYYLINSSLWD